MKTRLFILSMLSAFWLLTACGGGSEKAKEEGPKVIHELNAADVQRIFEGEGDRVEPVENVSKAKKKMSQALDKAIKDGEKAGLEEEKLTNLRNAKEMLQIEFKRFEEMAGTEIVAADGEIEEEHIKMHKASVNQNLEQEILTLNEQLRLMIEE